MMVVCAPHPGSGLFGLLESGSSNQGLVAQLPTVSRSQCSWGLPVDSLQGAEWPACGSFCWSRPADHSQTWLFKHCTSCFFYGTCSVRHSKLSNLKLKKYFFCIQWQIVSLGWKKKVCRRISSSVVFNFVPVFSSILSLLLAGRGWPQGQQRPWDHGCAFVFTRGSLFLLIVHFSSGLFPVPFYSIVHFSSGLFSQNFDIVFNSLTWLLNLPCCFISVDIVFFLIGG